MKRSTTFLYSIFNKDIERGRCIEKNIQAKSIIEEIRRKSLDDIVFVYLRWSPYTLMGRGYTHPSWIERLYAYNIAADPWWPFDDDDDDDDFPSAGLPSTGEEEKKKKKNPR